MEAVTRVVTDRKQSYDRGFRFLVEQSLLRLFTATAVTLSTGPG